jgi:hypothetical protein
MHFKYPTIFPPRILPPSTLRLECRVFLTWTIPTPCKFAPRGARVCLIRGGRQDCGVALAVVLVDRQSVQLRSVGLCEHRSVPRRELVVLGVVQRLLVGRLAGGQRRRRKLGRSVVMRRYREDCVFAGNGVSCMRHGLLLPNHRKRVQRPEIYVSVKKGEKVWR